MDDPKNTQNDRQPQAEDNKADENRGNPPGYGNGEVTGAGAGAGGSGGPEDYDADPMGGGGSFPPAGPTESGEGADAPSHGTR